MGKQSQAPQQYQGGGQQNGPGMPQSQSRPGDLHIGGQGTLLGATPFGQDVSNQLNGIFEAAGINAPGSPDYYGAATQTGLGNRPNIDTPFGSQQWTVGPDGQWHLQVGMNGALGGASTALGQQAGDALSHSLDLSSLGAIPDPTQTRQQAQDAAYAQAQKRLDPMFQHREDALRTQLLNQGLDPNSEAAKGAMEQESNARNDAYSSAMNAAVQQGNEAGQQFFNQGMMARQQQLAELLKQRGLPLEEMQALLGLTQTPQFNQGPDYLGAAGLQGQYDMGAWNAQNANRADALKGFGSMGQSLTQFLPFLL